MMWRTPPEPNLAPTVRPGARRLAERSRDRQRIRLVGGLRSVARRANTRPRASRYEVLLCERASTVRPQLLEVAASLERAADPEPDTLEALRSLLTDGCTSPLYNPEVPAAHLLTILDRVQAELDAREPGTRDLSAVALPGVAPGCLATSAAPERRRRPER
jgi:hypothetical protein